MYLIWSVEHNAWWCAREHGYTWVFKNAGRYTLEHALKICNKANESDVREVPIEESVAKQLKMGVCR